MPPLTHEEKYLDSLTLYKSVSIPLKNIVRSPLNNLYEIDAACTMISRISSHMFMFLKLYILYCYEKDISLPNINVQFLIDIAKIICTKTDIDADDIFDDGSFYSFYHCVYVKTMNPNDRTSLHYINLSQCIKYESKKIITALSNHISAHFVKMLNTLVNIECEIDSTIKWIKNMKNLTTVEKNKRIRLWRSDLRHVKNDILNNTNTADETYDDVKRKIIYEAFGGPDQIPLIKKYINTEKSLKLLKMCIGMSRMGEETMKYIKHDLPKNERKFKIINVFPLKTSVIPGYMDIDTVIVIRLLLEENKEYYGLKENFLSKNLEIWNKIFKMNHTVFKKKGYIFDRRISTDGFGCSILFIRKDKYNPNAKTNIKHIKKPYNYKEDKYIDELSDDELNQIEDTTSNDPGYHDIAFFTDGKEEIVKKANGRKCRKVNKMRFTQNQRRFETKSKLYLKRIDKDKKKKKIRGRTVKDIESDLSKYNSNTCIFKKAIKWTKTKNEVSYILRGYYTKDMYRYLKWSSKVNRKKCDDRLINRFREKFGPPEKVTLLYGDQDQRGMKFMEPTKGKSMRRLFKSKGYKVYLVDEFRTSARLYDEPGINGEGIEMEKFLEVDNPRPYRRERRPKVMCHGLLRSKIYTNVIVSPESSTQDKITKTLINRNLNASLNILYKGQCVIYGQELPKRFKRGN